MTRDEAIEILKNSIWYYPPDNGFEYNKRTDVYIAAEVAIEALRGSQSDAETGLMPCGCGGKACEYCTDSNEQQNLFEENNYAPYSGMESTISINRQQDGRYIICADLWGGSNCVADFEIFFCPMCGRELK